MVKKNNNKKKKKILNSWKEYEKKVTNWIGYNNFCKESIWLMFIWLDIKFYNFLLSPNI